jgi:prepilin-type N-terminal cleavage/methylation domain-containing protein
MKHLHNRKRHRENGLSLIEMLVSIVVIGISVAGLTATLWINGLFTIRQFNKVDNISEANHFLELLGRDVRAAASIGYMSAPYAWTDACNIYTPPATISDAANMNTTNYLSNNTLILQIPHLGANGLPMGVPTPPTEIPPTPVYDTVVYQLGITDNTTQTMVRTLIPNSLVGGASVQTYVLNGVIGPTPASNYRMFDYVSAGTIVSPGARPFNGEPSVMRAVSSVIVNLDLQCTNASSRSTSNTNAASLGIRRQYVMRNHIAAWNLP